MCIRDSNDGKDALQLPLIIAGAAPFAWELTQDGAPVSLTTCLLYTSDAADERSSVDLGGRRIIKKKTRDTQGGDGH